MLYLLKTRLCEGAARWMAVSLFKEGKVRGMVREDYLQFSVMRVCVLCAGDAGDQFKVQLRFIRKITQDDCVFP